MASDLGDAAIPPMAPSIDLQWSSRELSFFPAIPLSVGPFPDVRNIGSLSFKCSALPTCSSIDTMAIAW